MRRMFVKVYLASLPVVAIVCTAILPIVAVAMPTLSPPIRVAQDARDAVAIVDPDRPIQIEVVNAGGVPITSRLTQPPTDDRRVTPGNSVTFGSTHTSYLPPPIYLLVSPEAENIGLSLYVTVKDNGVKVVVAAARSDTPGSTSMRIAPDGGIYVY